MLINHFHFKTDVIFYQDDMDSLFYVNPVKFYILKQTELYLPWWHLYEYYTWNENWSFLS